MALLYGIKAIHQSAAANKPHISGFQTARTAADDTLHEWWNGATVSAIKAAVDKDGKWYSGALTAGDILYAVTGGVANVRRLDSLAIGAIGTMLRSDGSIPAWSTATFPLAATQGDLLFATSADTWLGLGIGTALQLLQTNAGGTAPEWTSTVNVNAASATVLQTARLINGVSFDGSDNITVPAAADTLTGGTVAIARGGTNIGVYVIGDILYASATGVLSKLAIGAAGEVLAVSVGLPSWQPAGSPGSHVLATTAGLGASHTTSGLTTGQVLRATAATTAAFQVLIAADIPNLDTAKITTGTFANSLIAASNVTQHEAALAIAATQITGTIPVTQGGTNLSTWGGVGRVIVSTSSTAVAVVDSGASGGFLRSNGTTWVRNTIQSGDLPSHTPSAHTHAAADITSGTFSNSRISSGNVTQHQGAITSVGTLTSLTVSGVATFSHASGVSTNDVTERSAGSGVDIDGVTLKDAEVVIAGDRLIKAKSLGIEDWQTPTGSTARTTFVTSSVTLVELAKRVGALIQDFHTTGGHGLIGS